MDIEFFCSHCGQSLCIDESGAGTTVDCPNCAKPAYVPSKPVEQPTRVTPISMPPSQAETKKPLGQPSRSPTMRQSSTIPVTLPGHNLALSAGESAILQARMHGAVVALPAILMGILFVGFAVIFGVIQSLFRALLGGLMPPGGAMPTGPSIMPIVFTLTCLPLLFICAIGTFVAWLARSHTLITLTNRRLIINQGVLSKTTVELMLKQIETVAIRRPLLGRIFGWGTVLVRGTGGGVFALQFLENAEQMYSKLQEVTQTER